MSQVYDNWERLVRATLKREELRLSALRPPSNVSFASLSASSFSLSESSGKICYMLCARELSIAWKNDSRFSEVAELLNVCWLDIRGKMKTRVLSLKTTYAAYLVYKIRENSHGLGVAAKAFIRLARGQEVNINTLVSSDLVEPESDFVSCLLKNTCRCNLRNRWWSPQLEPHPVHQTGLDNSFVIEPGANNSVYLKPPSTFKDDLPQKIEGRVPHERNDGWLEVFLGEFFNDEGEGEIEMQLSETKILNWKRGLIVEGIELRLK
ncbi:hypothetical protein ACH5RR_031735 [Cinchona calisaya]|uniref:Uncharacterized protein n=1 Tax=Cinchona calisaya TaxID=153742 RepID=A0ABD2YG32_9GENT